MDYMRRIADDRLALKLESFGATLILGPKGCGKTTTGKRFAKSVVEFQDEDQRDNLLMIANTKPSDLLRERSRYCLTNGRTLLKYGALSGKTWTIRERSVNIF